MLFNSYEFIFVFLPVTLLVFWRIGGIGHHRAAIAWLVGASLFFYAWWNPAYLGLILASMLFNYAVGVALGCRPHKGLLVFGVTANLALLGYYKYANFFATTVNDLSALNWHLEHIVLPLAISFFTFQQIAYLVDAWKGEAREYSFLHYCLFVAFFPQLIAGPIVHHREMLPQFAQPNVYRLNHGFLALGLSIFTIGLFKKVMVADNLAPYASEAFAAVARGTPLTFFEAWRGTLAYSFQLYFDFSGYSDMAIGLAAMFGIQLPLNFASPYKATSIIDFWKRWHMTLSRFLRDYLYFPLGGNRKGPVRRYLNLLITMVLGGLWHGAAWTFVAWGALHGIFLIINHAWRSLRGRLGWPGDSALAGWTGRVLTFLCVALAWVFFRAADFDSAMRMMHGLVGLNGFAWPGAAAEFGIVGQWLSGVGIQFADSDYFKGGRDVLIMGLLLTLVWRAPNTQELMADHFPLAADKASTTLRWRPTRAWAMLLSGAALFSVLRLSQVSEFLYFQF